MPIKGVDKVWADIIGRWTKLPTMWRLVQIPELPSSEADDFEWPNTMEIANEQPTSMNHAQWISNWKRNCGSMTLHQSGFPMIQPICKYVCASSHTPVLVDIIVWNQPNRPSKNLFWPTLSSDIKAFSRSGIHCLSTIAGEKVPRPFGSAVHRTKSNDLLTFDYIKIAHGTNGEKHVLVLRKDHSNYAWFFATGDTSVEQAAAAIVD